MANAGSFRKGEKRPNQGKHGPHKATINAKEAIARFVDGNADRLQGWLEEIAQAQGPLAAFKCFADVLEYHVPKLSRAEVTADVTVRSAEQELAELNKKAHG
jgi:hypothetical protein